MEKFTEEIKTTRTVFRAVDGKIFDTEEKCKEWEKSYECTVLAMWNKVKKEKIYSNSIYPNDYDNVIYLVKVEDMETLKVINAYLQTCDKSELLTQEHIGKEVLIEFGDCNDWYYIIGTVEQHIAGMQRQFDNLHNKLNGIKEEE